jgi:hypothetical protein
MKGYLMSDDIETPKRKYTRRGSMFGNDKLDDAAASIINDVIDAADDLPQEVEVEVEPIQSESKEVKFLGEEPVSNSITSKIAKKLGYRKSMENIPWKGIDRWVCQTCKWETFDKQRAKAHSC